ncbi:hypothetical protein KR067_011060, partial [Drosophila pandora]
QKTPVKDSKLCKKCICDIKNSFLDCNEKLGDWFSSDQWNDLTNGDVVFKTIRLEHNNLTTIPALPAYGVENLYLGFNQIENITLGAFRNLSELVNLDISHNKLTTKTLVPDVFQGPYSTSDYKPLPKLRSLNLGYNDLHSLDGDIFEHIPQLEELVLCSNPFQIINKNAEVAISGLAYLKVTLKAFYNIIINIKSLLSSQTLDISYLEIDELPETVLHGPRDLNTLLAAGNEFRSLPDGLEYAQNLIHLVLNENPIENLVGDNVFPNMTSLKYLSMSFMPKLYKIGPGAFSELQNLTELILSDNKFLNEIDELAFSKNVTGGPYLDYPPLEHFFLNNCNLTVLPKPLLVRWDKVKVLDLQYNPWRCDSSNDYLINELIGHVNKTNSILAKNVKCAFPDELKDVTVLRVADEHLVQTPGASLVWIGLLVVLLIVIPTVVAAYAIKKRGCFGRFRRSDSVANRALYNRTSFNEDFHI